MRPDGAAEGPSAHRGRVAQGAVTTRLRALVEAGINVSSELSLDAVLQRIVEAAAEITGAPYAALGVIDRSGRGLERFVTTGIPRDRRAPTRPRDPRRAHPRRAAAAARRSLEGPAFRRVPAQPSTDEKLPRR